MQGKMSCEKLIKYVHSAFLNISDGAKRSSSNGIKLIDCLMSGLAIFHLKYESLLQFDRDFRNKNMLSHNLKSLYLVNTVPSDTYLRTRLDKVSIRDLRKAFKSLFALFQRSKFLKLFEFYPQQYILALDGTGIFSSTTIHCKNCCEKRAKDGSITYYHQLLAGAIVHPNYKIAIPFAPEPIIKEDGAKKNDCERNAAYRFLDDLKREHPHLKLIITADSLFANGHFLKRLKKDEHHFIIIAKEDDHTYLLDEFRTLAKEEYTKKQEGFTHRFRFMNGLAINDSHHDCQVNVLEYWETNPKNKEKHWVWVTDIPLSKDNVYEVMRGGRSKWKIENETFNTLKNQGYHFEHNFGHGEDQLSSVFANLMMLAFFMDQLQELCCKTFKEALENWGSRRLLWIKQRGYFDHFYINGWDDLMLSLAKGHKKDFLSPDSS